jgi:ABC-type multidrug transport system ATPase subunit
MDLSIQKLSKAFNQRLVFHELTFIIPSGARVSISGPNGSGKSTLLKILSGGMLPTAGRVHFTLQGVDVPEDELYKHVHFVAPYNTVIEELTLPELFDMHQRLGLLSSFRNYKEWVHCLEYPFHPVRPIKTYSSGMKQRVKLGLVMLDNRPLILLDEPGSNLDAQGKTWFYALVARLDPSQTLVIATNEESEKELCTTGIEINSYEGKGRD